jgi:hypothetical protein
VFPSWRAPTLDANPLDDIHNTRKIAGVMISGRYFPKVSMEKMLVDAEALARRKSFSEPLMKALSEGGVAAAAQHYRLRKQEAAVYDFAQDALIDFAFELLTFV